MLGGGEREESGSTLGVVGARTLLLPGGMVGRRETLCFLTRKQTCATWTMNGLDTLRLPCSINKNDE